jgi:hypothetical protein
LIADEKEEGVGALTNLVRSNTAIFLKPFWSITSAQKHPEMPPPEMTIEYRCLAFCITTQRERERRKKERSKRERGRTTATEREGKGRKTEQQKGNKKKTHRKSETKLTSRDIHTLSPKKKFPSLFPTKRPNKLSQQVNCRQQQKEMNVLASVFFALLSLFAFFLHSHTHFDLPVEEIKAKWGNEQSRYLTCGDFFVHYRDEGQKDKPLLVLIHGTAAFLQTWDPWVELLKNDFHILRMDVPSFGISGPALSPSFNYSMFEYATFIRTFLECLHLENEKVFIAGSSLGGGIAWMYGSRFPEHVGGLILVDPVGIVDVDHVMHNWTLPRGIRIARIPILNQLFQYVTPRFFVGKNLREVIHDDELVTFKYSPAFSPPSSWFLFSYFLLILSSGH